MTEQIFIPDSTTEYLKRTTHLSIAAHQDDLEIMSADGIVKCLNNDKLWFGGVICTDGAGSSRIGEFASYTDEQMKEVRASEQNKAAQIGQYSFVSQLGYTSAQVKNGDSSLIEKLKKIIISTRPDVIYTHNPFDKHPTHVAVFKATLSALIEVKDQYLPKQFLGCEVWRNLDWIADNKKIGLNLTGHEKFLLEILGVFKSQIAGGKRYDLATLGRMRANATYFDSHHSDQVELMTFAIDLLPLISQLSLKKFADQHLDSLKQSIKTNLLI